MKKKSKRKTKNNNKKILVVIIISLIITVILSFITVSENKLTRDERYFKIEYEKYNGKKSSSGEEYISVSIKDDNNIEYLTGKETVDFMKKKTGIIYFGFPQCSWCRSAIEVLIDASIDLGIDKIYYYNGYGDRDEKYIGTDGEIITAHKGSNEYYQILELLDGKAQVYEGLNDENLKRLYFPTVLFIKNGKIVDMHVSTVDSNKDENKKLSSKEYKKLKKIYINGIKKIK